MSNRRGVRFQPPMTKNRARNRSSDLARLIEWSLGTDFTQRRCSTSRGFDARNGETCHEGTTIREETKPSNKQLTFSRGDTNKETKEKGKRQNRVVIEEELSIVILWDRRPRRVYSCCR